MVGIIRDELEGVSGRELVHNKSSVMFQPKCKVVGRIVGKMSVGAVNWE